MIKQELTISEPLTSHSNRNDWECKQCCTGNHCGKCYCCVNHVNELAKKRQDLHTVLAENYQLDKETGLPCKFGWVLYSAPCLPAMAKSLAEQLKMVNKSYRIVTKDNKPGRVIIDEWLREGFMPDDKIVKERK